MIEASFDAQGRSAAAAGAYQYDTGQRVRLHGLPSPEELAQRFGIRWLPSDFKKKEGYKRSIQLSAEYDLYRQDYCGCAFSKAEAQRRKDNKN